MSLNDDEKDDLLLACRYGDLEDVQAFVKQYGSTPLADIRDDNKNCMLHMVCANGHIDLLNYLLPILPPSMLSVQNTSGSTPLHWAALNKHLDIAQKIVQHPEGPGLDLIDVKNTAGHSPLGEAELAGWEEGAKWFVEVMNLDPEQGSKEQDEDDATLDDGVGRDIEVEIEDADGQIAKMTISGANVDEASKSS
ncbi:ankyrin repeat-containing domain protein [Crassisporium funariophilum]|nr:ankyrin repeat-containing domain protein [Crassisporium funariophilum]